MIAYKGAYCGTKLETEDSLSGKQETCPTCRKVNHVPLSTQDRAEEKKRLKEKLQQEQTEARRNALAAQEQNQRQRAAEVELEIQRQPAEQFQPRHPQRRSSTRADLTETAFGILGILCVVIGTVGGAVVALSKVAEGAAGGRMLFWCVLGALAGFLVGMPYFAMQLVLRYLRRIMNAVEGGE